MRTLKISLGLVAIMILATACGGGGGTTAPPPPPGTTGGEVTISSFVASPMSGPAPLGVNFSVTVAAGKLPMTYLWDFNNDGSYDYAINKVGSRTAQAYHQYYLRAEDVAAGTSSYEAVVKVIDDDNIVKSSDPRGITVTATDPFQLDVRVISDYITGMGAAGVEYAYLSEKPVYFRVNVVPLGQESGPYAFTWDFDGDGDMDSALQNPQYTFTLVGDDESMEFHPRLIVTDANGIQVVWEPPPGTAYVVTREIPLPPEAGEPELIVNTSPLTQSGDIIDVYYDTTSEEPSEREPHVSASATVDIAHPGVPPYTYDWDFTSDGVIDARTPAVVVPYFDPDLNVVVNPYVLPTGEARGTFMLSLHFADTAGYATDRVWKVKVTDRAHVSEVNPLDVTAYVDLDGNETFDTTSGTPLDAQQYRSVNAESADDSEGLIVKVRATATGSTNTYRFQIDILGDGVWAEDTDGDLILDWDPQFSGTRVPVDLDPDDESEQDAAVELASVALGTNNQATFTIHFPPTRLPGFFAMQLKTAAMEGGLEAASLVEQIPISLVVVNGRDFTDTSEEPVLRTDFGMVGVTSVNTGVTPNTLTDRYAFIAGGMNGNLALRDVQAIVQSYNVDDGMYDPEYDLLKVPPMMVPRGQLGLQAVSLFANTIYGLGGYNNTGGTLSLIESYGGGHPWQGEGTIRNNDTKMRLFSMASGALYPTTGGDMVPVIVLTGGLVGDPDRESVSSTVWVYLPPNGWYDFYTPMPTPRYDCATVIARQGNYSYLYVIGGRGVDGSSLRTIERLRLVDEAAERVSGGWEALPDMHAPRAGTGAAFINGRIYVYGGEVYPPGGVGVPTMVPSTEVFNPVRGIWSYSVPPVAGAGMARFGLCAFPSWLIDNGDGTYIAPLDTVWIYGGTGEDGISTQLIELFYEDQKNFGL